jgi:DNA-binding NtrC family response regulator
MTKLLIVEDQPAVAKALQVLFEIHGIESVSARNADEALEILGRQPVSVVIQDMNFSGNSTSGEEGIRLFRDIKRRDPQLPVLLITAWTSLETAVQLIKEGASDYISKPWDDEKLLATVGNLLRLRELQVENNRLRDEQRRVRQTFAEQHDLRGLIFASPVMDRLIALAVQVARSDVPVLITGPNGTGKEKLAEVIQANSPRLKCPFLKVNLGALPENLLESELFGAEAGAYTGVSKMRIGRFEAADSGTLFLDEIGNLSPTGQMKLLRVLQSGEFERLGSNRSRKADVRILCATNTDLRQAIQEGQFREDLLFRLNVIELKLPALADRKEDILPLAEAFLEEEGRPRSRRPTLSKEATRLMLEYPWPGNVRELKNRITRAVLICSSDSISPADLGLEESAGAARQGAPAAPPGAADPGRNTIEDVLVRNDGIVSRAAKELGISRQALYRKMEKLGIVLERRPTRD